MSTILPTDVHIPKQNRAFGVDSGVPMGPMENSQIRAGHTILMRSGQRAGQLGRVLRHNRTGMMVQFGDGQTWLRPEDNYDWIRGYPTHHDAGGDA